MKRLAFLLCLTVSADAADLHQRWLPRADLTPGAINPAVSQATMKSNICNRRWSTKSIRPKEEYTTALKKKQLIQYGYANKSTKLYEEDHLISLELGGHPTDPRNLWPEIWDGPCGAHVKDELENRLHDLVCAGKVRLADAQRAIASDWVAAYNRYVKKVNCN